MSTRTETKAQQFPLDLCSIQRRALAWLEEHGIAEIRHGKRIINRTTIIEDWQVGLYLLRLEGEE